MSTTQGSSVGAMKALKLLTHKFQREILHMSWENPESRITDFPIIMWFPKSFLLQLMAPSAHLILPWTRMWGLDFPMLRSCHHLCFQLWGQCSSSWLHCSSVRLQDSENQRENRDKECYFSLHFISSTSLPGKLAWSKKWNPRNNVTFCEAFT